MAQQDPFQKMLLWSAMLHVVLLVAFVVASSLAPRPSILPEPSVAWVVPGVPGPVPGGGGGGTPTPPPPKPEPEPEPPEPPEKEEPRVVRPTKEEREQLPMPDAKTQTQKPKPEKPPSGLVGRDAASAPSAQLKDQGPGSGLPGLGLGGEGGGGSPFDQDFEYAYYVQQMLAKIHQNWQRVALQKGSTAVVIRFTIFRDGHVENVEVETTSGVALLDRAAERAVLLSDPMPPLPNSYPRDQVGVHLRFEYSDRY